MAGSDAEEPSGPGRLLSGLLRRVSKSSAPSEEYDAPPPGPTAKPATENTADPGWIRHEAADGAGFEGWLYHYADGTMASEDGTVYEHTGSGALVDSDAEAESQPEQEPEPVPEPKPEPEPAPEPEPEPEPEFESEPERELQPEREPEPERDTEESPGIPTFVEYSPSELRSYVLGAVLVLASVTAVLTLFVVAPDPDAGGLLLVAGLAAVAAVAGWALASWTPTVVSIRDGVLEVARGSHEEHFDLRDPGTRVELGIQPGSPSWRTTLARPDGHTAVIGARHVKASHFTQLVEHHRSRLRTPESPTGDDS